MVTGEKYIYIHFPKTGGNSIRGYLRKFDDTNEDHPFHGTPNSSQISNKIPFTSVRNPFSWYVSYWNVTRNGEGTLARTANRFPALDGKFETFSGFMNFFLVECKNWPYKNIWNPLGNLDHGVKHGLGAYSTGFFNMTVPTEFSWHEKSSFEDFWSLCCVEDFIKTENLRNDLKVLLEKLGYDASIVNEDKFHRNNKKSQYKSYREYYTPELVDLVMKKDSFLMDKFCYSFE